MLPDTWAAVDDFIDSLTPADSVLESTLAATVDAGLPEISVSAAQGQFLSVLATSVQAESILEIGTLGGYSTICLARAMPEPGVW